MKVILAGYNVDSEVIKELKKACPSREDVTPETLSAAYARISRDPRPVSELRSSARAEVEKARRSNRNVVFKMGHQSVAEHAVFNFDVIGVSRLAIEEIEKFRLCSYTEKSQRYITLEEDFVIPEEIKRAGKEKVFIETVKSQNALYQKLYEKLKLYVWNKHKELAENPRKHFLLDGWAKEDARYVLSLATTAQLGMTINARNLEFLIRRFASRGLEELQEFNHQIFTLAKRIAPSLIRYTEPHDFDSKTYEELRAKVSRVLKPGKEKAGKPVQLVDFTPEADTKLVASIMHTSSASSYIECLEKARKLKLEEKEKIVRSAFRYMEFYDAALREFEYVDLMFDLVISASCFAQLKRHRMATLTAQDYDPALGVTIPPSVEEIGALPEFAEVVEKTNGVYKDLKKILKRGADYVLTNAHRRRVLFKVNARELYHMTRLREDATAHWDIRRVAGEMSRLARRVMPLSCLLLGGKDAFAEAYKRVFGRSSKPLPPKGS